MNSPANLQLKIDTLDIIKTYRVPDLQALLDYACLSRQGNKTELFQRCKTLISANLTPQLLNKINQINLARMNSSRTYHNQHSIVLTSSTIPIDNLPLPQQIQHVHLPFYDKIRTIECTNMSVDKKTFSPLRFTLIDFDVDFILKGTAKIFLRIAPTIIHDKQNDVLPPYVFIQCNGQTIINNNIAKTVGSQAHTISFPIDITDKVIPKLNVHNSLNYFWLQSPNTMSFKNLPKSYTLTIQLVRCISLDSLIENILKHQTQLMKKDQNDSDIEIEDIGLMTTRHRVSLLCPITQSLIHIPTKSSFCSHLTCFDLRSFLQMNERRLQWTCPLCKKPASYETLHLDKRLQSILSNVPANCSTVEFDSSTNDLSDCQYILDNIKQEKPDNVGNNTSHNSNDDEEEESIHNSSIKSRRQSTASDCVILSSGSESEDENEIEEEEEEEQANIQTSDSPVAITPLSTNLCTRNNNNNNSSERQTNSTDQSSNADHSLQSSVMNNIDDESYWEDIARFTYDLISTNSNNEQNLNRKRNNSSNSSLLSNNGDHHHHHQRKRKKRSSTNNIEVITLSSSDSSDNDDELS